MLLFARLDVRVTFVLYVTEKQLEQASRQLEGLMSEGSEYQHTINILQTLCDSLNTSMYPHNIPTFKSRTIFYNIGHNAQFVLSSKCEFHLCSCFFFISL